MDTYCVVLFQFAVVATEHSRDSWKPWYYRKIDRLLAKRTASLVTVSSDTASFYHNEIGIDDSLIRVINNGIETERFANGCGASLKKAWIDPETQGDTFIIGTVGRIVPAKNHRRLIDALVLLNADKTLTHMAIKLVVVGEGSEQQAIEEYVAQQGLSDQVVFTGTRQDIPDVLDAFDLFVLSSDREGHPLTALEAQAAGTPVVLTDAGGAKEAIAMLGEQSGGLLVERSAEAMAEAMKSIMGNTEATQQRSAFARSFALANFDLKHMVERYAIVFDAAKRS